MKRILIAVVVLGALTACSGTNAGSPASTSPVASPSASIDDQWRSMVEKEQHIPTISDALWAQYKAVFTDPGSGYCAMSQTQADLSVAGIYDDVSAGRKPTISYDVLRANIANACPEDKAIWDRAADEVARAVGASDPRCPAADGSTGPATTAVACAQLEGTLH